MLIELGCPTEGRHALLNPEPKPQALNWQTRLCWNNILRACCVPDITHAARHGGVGRGLLAAFPAQASTLNPIRQAVPVAACGNQAGLVLTAAGGGLPAAEHWAPCCWADLSPLWLCCCC